MKKNQENQENQENRVRRKTLRWRNRSEKKKKGFCILQKIEMISQMMTPALVFCLFLSVLFTQVVFIVVDKITA